MPWINLKYRAAHCGLILCLSSMISGTAQASEKYKHLLPRYYKASTNETGTLGLNTVPSARMDKAGTVRIGAGTSDPYIHSFMGFQFTDSFYASVRQTAETSSLTSSPDSFYPGLDFKLRLWEETATRPAMVVGMDSAFGVKRMASEYVSLSKRFGNFDFTSGVAWGRLGSAGHIKNPFRSVSSHFKKERDYSATNTQDIEDWFTGEDIGVFGGIEYFTPLKGLSLKADYGANDYVGEQTITGFKAPDPWAISLNYKPIDQADLSFGIIGGDKVMARLSLQDQLSNWLGKSGHKRQAPELTSPRALVEEGNNKAKLALSPYRPTARQVGHAARVVANQSDIHSEALHLSLQHKGLKGPSVTLIRDDLEKAVLHHQRSPEEIWRNAIIEEDDTPKFNFKNLLNSNLFKKNNYTHAFKFILEQKLSLSEADTGILYRTSGLVEAEKVWPFGLINGASARVNIANNLSRLNETRFRIIDPVRSDEDIFAARRFGIDRFYATWMKTIAKDTHAALTAGYLEEMYAGFGGEVLYRPFGKTLAIGAEGWQTYKRDPLTVLNKNFTPDGRKTGHLNLFYEVPNTNMTAYFKIGQYIRGDAGGTFGLKKLFNNGSSLEGFLTTTNQKDLDILGETTHLYGGIRFTLPFGNIPYVPDGSEVRFSTGPIARDIGQTIDKPQPLYEVTEPISYRQLNQSWGHLLD